MSVLSRIIVALAVSLFTIACQGRAGGELLSVTVDELSAQLKGAKPPRVFDANSSSTREKFGVIPTATLLDGRKFDLQVLPESRADSLVFYCSSTLCTSAEGAAHRAVEGGYSDVKVLRAGIKGWKRAGKETVSPSS